MNVVPTARCTAVSSVRKVLRSFASSAPNGLVEQQHGGPAHERPGQRDALLLAAGQLNRPAAGEPGEPHEFERLGRATAPLRPVDARPPAQPVLHVLRHSQVREQRVALEDGVDRALVGGRAGEIRAVEQDATVGGFVEAADHPQRRGLAAARRTQQREELAAAIRRSMPSTATASPCTLRSPRGRRCRPRAAKCASMREV
jgi:hypothetical protein